MSKATGFERVSGDCYGESNHLCGNIGVTFCCTYNDGV